jgi:hypothetical protein
MNLGTTLLSIAFVLLAIVVVLTYESAPAWQTVLLVIATVLVGQALGRSQ